MMGPDGTVRQVCTTGPGTKGPLVQVLHEAILPLDLVEGIGLSNVPVLNPPQVLSTVLVLVQ